METEMIKAAIVTGGHAYDVIHFHELFRSLVGVNSYIQHLDDFATSTEAVRDGYDVVLLYIMMMNGPSSEGLPGHCGRPKTALERLGQTEQGLVVLHHGLLAYPHWSVWNEIVGISDRNLSGCQHDETLRFNVVDKSHPITQGLSDWTMVDETYNMADAGPGSQILLAVEHKRSMKTVAWTRQYKASRVFCLQSGHDNQAWANPNFREVLRRGIVWSGGRLF
jgi:hypothetical protein